MGYQSHLVRRLLPFDDAKDYLRISNSPVQRPHGVSGYPIQSHALNHINQLRRAEGLPPWQTSMSNSARPLGVGVHERFRSKLNAYAPTFGQVRMTKYHGRRMLSDRESIL